MGYEVPDWKKSIKQNVYPVTIGTKVFDLPRAKFLTGEQAELFEHADTQDGGVYTIFDSIVPGLGTALKKIPIGFLEELIEDWQKDSGITLGESSPSEKK